MITVKSNVSRQNDGCLYSSSLPSPPPSPTFLFCVLLIGMKPQFYFATGTFFDLALIKHLTHFMLTTKSNTGFLSNQLWKTTLAACGVSNGLRNLEVKPHETLRGKVEFSYAFDRLGRRMKQLCKYFHSFLRQSYQKRRLQSKEWMLA